MRKLAFLLSLVLILLVSFNVVSIGIAQESSKDETTGSVMIQLLNPVTNEPYGDPFDSSTVSPRTVEWLLEKHDLVFQGRCGFQVTPTEGRNLKLSLNNKGGAVKVEVWKNGGWWSSNTFVVSGTGTNTYDLKDNCNGEPYTIYFDSNSGWISFVITQTEYI